MGEIRNKKGAPCNRCPWNPDHWGMLWSLTLKKAGESEEKDIFLHRDDMTKLRRYNANLSRKAKKTEDIMELPSRAKPDKTDPPLNPIRHSSSKQKGKGYAMWASFSWLQQESWQKPLKGDLFWLKFHGVMSQQWQLEPDGHIVLTLRKLQGTVLMFCYLSSSYAVWLQVTEW